MSYKFSIIGSTIDGNLFANIRNVSIANAFRNIGSHFQGVAVGAISEVVTLNCGPTFASGIVTITSGNITAAQTITINGVVLTASATPANQSQFLVGSTALQTGISLAAIINAHTLLKGIVRASYAKSSTSAIVTVTAVKAGTGGNYTWSETASNTVLTPLSALSGGADGPISATATVTFASTGPTNSQTMTLGNTTLTAKTSGSVAASGEFDISATPSVVATNLAAAINAVAAFSGVFTASAALGVVTVTAVAPGITGNGFQIDAGTLSNTTVVAFAGGVNANVVTLHKGI